MQPVADSAMYFFRHQPSDLRLASNENRWLAKFAPPVKCKQRVESSHAIITNMVFGVENLKSSDIKQVFISSLQSESERTRARTLQEVAA
jgi:hypothetical protein